MIRILSLYGSPHVSGNTAELHNVLLKNLSHDENIDYQTFSMDFKPCDGCGNCDENLTCRYHDLDDFYNYLRIADIIILSSPIYFTSLPSTLKKIIDRCQLFWNLKKHGRVINRKTGYVIMTAGSDYENAFNPSLIVIRHFFNTINCNFDSCNVFLCAGLDNCFDNYNKIIKDIMRIGK